MPAKKEKQRNIKRIVAVIIRLLVAVIVLCVVGLYIYTSDYYRSEVGIEDYSGNSSYKIEEISEGLLVDGDGNADAIIFYPGAKVEYTAYLPLCVKLAEEGLDCFIVEMPFHLAILGMNKAGKIMDNYDYDNWYLAGHSLGGAMAANYVADNVEEFAGLIMLAAYPTKDLESEELQVISIYGNKDGILNKEKIEAGIEFVPKHYTEIEVDGANHAGFGNYGPQEGDGEAGIAREKQQEMSIQYIIKMIQTKK